MLLDCPQRRPYSVEERVQPTGAHAEVFSRRLQRKRMRGFEPVGVHISQRHDQANDPVIYRRR
ncbi:hypothetical protein ACFWDC_40965, partial [Streptomyces anthocyanicus]